MSTQASGGTEVPSHRACAHCRSQKVRCIVDDGSADVCQRCARSGKTCVFTPLQKRKQRKRTDTRVAELEREMRAMRAALQKKEQTGGTQSTGANTQPRPGLWYEENSLGAPVRGSEVSGSSVVNASVGKLDVLVSDRVNKQQGAAPRLWPTRFANKPPEDIKDVVDSGMISMATARQLFETYRRDLCPLYPIVIIPGSVTADQLRQQRPALFLAIIAAAAGKENDELSAMLDKEVLHTYATRHVVNSEKSLELVQALLISAVWYHPPTKFGQLKYYEYIHMAATMAMDIGIGTRSVPHRNLFGTKPQREHRAPNVHPLEDATNPDLSMTPRSRDHSPDTDSLESRRTFLACYIVCSGVSMSLRRPNMLRVSSYIRECLDYLERSSAELSDRTLAAWVRLNIVAEEICTSFSYDDPGEIASITDVKTQFMLRDYERRLSSWYTSTAETDMTPAISIMYYSIRIYLHEVALHVDHSPEDFKAPYQMGPVYPWTGDEIPTQILAATVADCITSAHNLMNTFISMDPEKGRGLPVFIYVRISFAAFVLAKLCLSAAHHGSRIGSVLDRSSLKVESFMDRAILHCRAIVGSARCRVPAIFLALLFKLRQWCMNPQMLERSSMAAAIGPTMELAKIAYPDTSKDGQSIASNGVGSSGAGEQLGSGDDNSSRDSIDSEGEQYESMSSYAEKTAAHLDPTTFEQFTPQSHTGDDPTAAASFTIPADAAPQTFPTGIDQPTSFLNTTEQMELDQTFLQFFGDMNALSQGGLTGLEDWSGVSTDLLGLPDNFDWQMTGATEVPLQCD